MQIHQQSSDKQRVLTPGHQGWNHLHSLCRIGMEFYLLNNNDNDNDNSNNDNNNNNNDDDDDDDNKNNNNNANDYDYNNDANNDNNENDNDKNSSRLRASHCIWIGVFKTKLPGIIDIIETMPC